MMEVGNCPVCDFRLIRRLDEKPDTFACVNCSQLLLNLDQEPNETA